MFGGAARIHKQRFDAYVDGAGVSIEVRQPAPIEAGSSDADRVFGRRSEVLPDAPVGTVTTLTAIWTTGYTSNPATGQPDLPPELASIGRTERLDVVIRCRLADALLDSANLHGKTIFHTAKDVRYGGVLYQVKGIDRTGLPPEGPYILWVGLRKAGE